MIAMIGWIIIGLVVCAGGTHAHRHVRKNFGGWSAARALGATRVKARVSRAIGIPLTASGRRRKLGAAIFKMFGL